jgi:LPS O-antigen subunit length determinant protein (WzzB/FepE family)
LLKDLLTKTDQLARLNPSIAAMLAQMQGQLLAQQSALSERQLRLELALSPLNTNQTQAIEEITSGVDPVSPKIRMITALSVVIGGFIGVLVALLMQAWANRRDAEPRPV